MGTYSRSQLESIARQAAELRGVPFELVAGVIQTESAWNPNAVSPAGARGIMQLMPRTFAGLGYDPAKIMDPITNIDAGTKYLAQMLQLYSGSWALAAMAYNTGPGNLNKALKSAKGSTDPYVISDHLPYQETRDYWKRVLNFAAVAGARITSSAAQAANKAKTVSREVVSWSAGSVALLVVVGLLAGALAAGVIRG